MLTRLRSTLPPGPSARRPGAPQRRPALATFAALASCVFAPAASGEPAGAPVQTGGPAPSSGPKRLLHYQLVAFSSDRHRGNVSPRVCSPLAGWSVHIAGVLQPLVQRLGPGAFDWWGHRTGGAWIEARIPLEAEMSTATEFEALDVARHEFRQLVNFAPLAEFARANGIDLYGYLGFPRCDDDPRFQFTPVPEHCDPAQMLRWYGEFLQFGFKGVGHDWSQHLPPGSGALRVNFPFLQSHGIEPFIEAIPERKDSHLLGWSVVVTENRLLYTENNPEKFFTADEIRQAGGRVIIIVDNAPKNFAGDVWRWRFDRSAARLREGETVAVSLAGLARAGHSIEELVELSRAPAASPDRGGDQPDPDQPPQD
jgi:hypothetical protein